MPPDEMTGRSSPVQNSEAFRSQTRNILMVGLALGILLMLVVLFAAPFVRDRLSGALANVSVSSTRETTNLRVLKRDVWRLENRVKFLRGNLQRLTPNAPYLIINTSENRIYLMSGRKLLHEGVCSSGSYVLLKASNNQQWMFSTPRGSFRVLGKQTAPVWRMPDWAFVEEGLPVPPPHAAERYEPGVLGEYGIDFGNGYLIHGTLYQRLLGMPVTHGCIRLGDEDLRIVYRHLQLGAKIFIY